MPETDPSAPLWQARFRAPIVGFPTWAADRPERIIYASSESGVYQLHAWDRTTGERRREGGGAVGHRDTTGDESGMWVAPPFAGGTAEPFVEGLPEAWDQGFAIGRKLTVAGTSDRDAPLHRALRARRPH